jgi:ornithine--oxo-acid transaminase
MIGLELETRFINAHSVAERMLEAGLLTKDTHGSVLRFAPPLVISKEELDAALHIIEKVLKTMWHEVIANNAYLGKILGQQNQSY